MATEEETDFFDISSFELELREKLNELQWKSDTLRETEHELSETWKLLYEAQTQLEEERRSRNQLKIQLEACQETLKSLEDEHRKKHSEYFLVKTKCETMTLERDILIEQAKIATFENMDLKIKNQEYERNLTNQKMIRDRFETTLEELENRVGRLVAYFHGIVSKLEREQGQLKTTAESALTFGSKIRCILKNNHIARKREKALIQELKNQIHALEASGQKIQQAPPQKHDTDSLREYMETNIKELQSRFEGDRVDDKLDFIIDDLKKMEARITANHKQFLEN